MYCSEEQVVTTPPLCRQSFRRRYFDAIFRGHFGSGGSIYPSYFIKINIMTILRILCTSSLVPLNQSSIKSDNQMVKE